jgi:TP901 family phage tail tape measure protein
MKSFTIPTVYTAVDKFTAPLRRMISNQATFAAGISRQERMFRKFTPALSETTQQMFAFAKSAAIAGAIIAGASFSVNAIKEYEDALASFRTIVGGTNQEFKKYSDQALIVGRATKTSAIDTVKAFESIAGLNADLAKTPEALGAITKAAIILSRGSGDELQKSAENLVGIMNQFNIKATESDRVINVLAAGQAVGASTITQTAEAFTVFGAVASTANISVEKSAALVQVLAKKMVLGSEAGTALRSTIGLLQKSGFGYKNGLFDINEALADAKKKYDSLGTAQKKDAFIAKTFGEVNNSTGTILLQNIDLFNQYIKGVTGTNEAYKAAAIKSSTLTAMLDQLKAKWVNMVVGSDGATTSLASVKTAIGFVTDNLETIVSVGVKVLLFFAAWKAIIIAQKIALTVYNGVIKAVTAAQWLWNAAMTANPLVLIIAGIIVLVGLVTAIIIKWNEWGAAVSILLGPLGLVISLIQSFRRNWEMITEAFKTGGILEGLKAIGKTMLDAVLMPIQQALELIAKLTGADWAQSAASKLQSFRTEMGVEAVNPKAAEQDALAQRIETTKNYQSSLTIEDKTGRAKLDNNNPFISMPKLTPTLNPAF